MHTRVLLAGLYESMEEPVLYQNNPRSNATVTELRHISAEDWYRFHVCDIRAEPVIDIFSITIESKLLKDNPETKYHVYGTIFVQDTDDDKKCFLYRRDVDEDNLEVISQDENFLTLGGPSDVISMKHPRLFIKIKDKRTGDHIVRGSVDLEQATGLEQVKTSLVQDRRGMGVGVAHVEYIALRFAVAADLNIQLFKGPVEYKSLINVEEEYIGIDVYGSIYAQYGHSYCGSASCHRIKLWESSVDEAEPLILGDVIPLDRWLIGVPAYTCLIIELDLKDRATGEVIVKGKAVFETMSVFVGIWQLLPGSNSNDIHAKVGLCWSEPCIYGKSYESRTETALEYPLYEYPTKARLKATPIFEIYSVFIGRENDVELSLSGTIIIDMCGDGVYTIFSATADDPCILKPGRNKLPLKFPFKTLRLDGTGHDYRVIVRLTDRENRLVINGYETSNRDVVGFGKHWLGRWVTTVFKGGREHGFAALHYRVFPYAVRATMSVGVWYKGPSALDGVLKGRLSGFYTNYEYQNRFEEEYYGIPLYEISPLYHRFEPGAHYDLKLVRPTFAVPVESNLRIQVHIRLRSQESRVLVGEIKKSVVFEFGCDNVVEEVSEAPQEQKQSDGSSFKIAISVKWS